MPEPLIAVIDDDASLRSAIVNLIRSLGYRASSHESADAFLASGVLAGVDCIVSDIHMPGRSGIDLKCHLDSTGHRIPVILVTARTEKSVLDSAMACKPFGLLKKPFDDERFVACLNQALAE